MTHILVIDDDRAIRRLLRDGFRDTDCRVETVGTGTDGLEAISQRRPDLVLLDVMLPDLSGLEVYREIQRREPGLPVIFITVSSDSDTAIQAVQDGACDYLMKPIDLGRVRELVRQLRQSQAAQQSNHASDGALAASDGDGQLPIENMLIGQSPAMLEVYKAIGRVAAQDVGVLIRGESGTGKELVARSIYQHSLRASGPFLAVNCAAIPETLLESELFGHEKGSFTGADRQRIGKFEQCSGGTIFLDEIGDMSPLVQSKLLRLLQEQRFERVGGNETIQTDVRIIAATHRNLEDMSQRGAFRADLFFRLNGYTITIPPLRDRRDDLLLLIRHFFQLFSQQLGKAVQEISPEAMRVLLEYAWPGNVRELQSALRRALLSTSGSLLTTEALPVELQQPVIWDAGPAGEGAFLTRFLDEHLRPDCHGLYAQTVQVLERYLFARVLSVTQGNRSQAARILGITRGCLRSKIRELKLDGEPPAAKGAAAGAVVCGNGDN